MEINYIAPFAIIHADLIKVFNNVSRKEPRVITRIMLNLFEILTQKNCTQQMLLMEFGQLRSQDKLDRSRLEVFR